MMKKNLILFFLPALVCALFLWGVGCTDSDKDAIVQFKGGALTVEDLDAHYNKLKKSGGFRNKTEELTPEFVFDHALNMEMIIAKGLSENLHLDPRIRAEIHGFMSDLFLKIMQDNLVPKIDRDAFTDEELMAFYKAHKKSYTSPAMLSVRLIKTADEASAKKAMAQIETGEIDFPKAAALYSSDKETAARGGDIGTRSLKKFQPGWRETIDSLEPNQVSGPHRITDAWYLFELTDRIEPVVHSFEDKKAYIRNDLLLSKYRQAWQKTYDNLKEAFEVKVDELQLQAFIRDRKKG